MGDDTQKKASVQMNPEFEAALTEFIEQIEAEDFEKAAACDFVNRFCQHMQDIKLDGEDIGMTAPCKVSFPTNATRDFFLGMFPEAAAKHEKASAPVDMSALSDELINQGVVKGGLAERLAAMGVQKYAKLAATRRKK